MLLKAATKKRSRKKPKLSKVAKRARRAERAKLLKDYGLELDACDCLVGQQVWMKSDEYGNTCVYNSACSRCKWLEEEMQSIYELMSNDEYAAHMAALGSS